MATTWKSSQDAVSGRFHVGALVADLSYRGDTHTRNRRSVPDYCSHGVLPSCPIQYEMVRNEPIRLGWCKTFGSEARRTHGQNAAPPMQSVAVLADEIVKDALILQCDQGHVRRRRYRLGTFRPLHDKRGILTQVGLDRLVWSLPTCARSTDLISLSLPWSLSVQTPLGPLKSGMPFIDSELVLLFVRSPLSRRSGNTNQPRWICPPP